jgi:photosystem II stability/assembly factor-like uncharacterized protein
MPYALLATDGVVFAGLADGQLWATTDRGDTWRRCALEGDPVASIHALGPGHDADPSERREQ